MPPRRSWPNLGPALGLLIALAAVSLAAETVLVILLRRIHPSDPVSYGIAALVGAALLVNFAAGVVVVRSGLTARRHEADLAADLARLMLRTSDLRSALDQAGQRLAGALGLSFASLELDEVAGDDRRLAIPLCEGDAVLGTLLVPSDLPTATRQRLRQRVVPSLESLLAAARDRQQINAALVESRQEQQQFFDLSSDLLVISTKNGVIRVNPAFERTLGYTLDDLKAMPLDLVVPQDQEQLKQMITDLYRGHSVRFENQAICSDGSQRWIEWNVAPHGDLFYAVGRDVTERRREQDALRQTQTMLETSRDQLGELAAQQAALRRVATLVARGVSPQKVFAAVADEMGRCLKVGGAAVSRFDGEAITLLALADIPPEIAELIPFGEQVPLEGDNVLTRVYRTGRSARMDGHERATGPIADRMRELGIQSVVAVPIVVGGRLWGTATAGSTSPEPLPPDIEERIGDFTDLAATAIANAAARSELQASRDKLSELADQQAALRRVATLVARGASHSEVFDTVAEEMRRCLRAVGAALYRYESSGEVTLLAASAAPPLPPSPVGERITTEGDNLAAMVWHTGRPARQDTLDNASGSIAEQVRELGIRAGVGAPIIVNGRLWGLAAVGSVEPGPMAPDTEARISDFAELVATAIANAAARSELQDSRDHLGVLATQQAALRRVATLVARGVNPSEVFSAVAEEMSRCLKVGSAAVLQYEPGEAAMVVASYAEPGEPSIPAGNRVTLEGDNVAGMVLRSGRPSRMDTFDGARGSLAARLRSMGMRSRVGAPIVVAERLWGAAIVGSSRPEPLPPDTEERIAEFADLVATAIAASTARADLIASRARIVAAADDARRRIERDLHDGAQQRLVSLGLKLRMAEDSVPTDRDDLRTELSNVVSGLNDVAQELQEISRGIHPAILSQGGLAAALRTLARRSGIPVDVEVDAPDDLPDQVEVA
ncbi:MAG TPA: GAF domain-containing protein, partial [Mycobacterium sp.]|nr:GAF domain-containing protein [Mycobacterium sp.]